VGKKGIKEIVKKSVEKFGEARNFSYFLKKQKHTHKNV